MEKGRPKQGENQVARAMPDTRPHRPPPRNRAPVPTSGFSSEAPRPVAAGSTRSTSRASWKASSSGSSGSSPSKSPEDPSRATKSPKAQSSYRPPAPSPNSSPSSASGGVATATSRSQFVYRPRVPSRTTKVARPQSPSQFIYRPPGPPTNVASNQPSTSSSATESIPSNSEGRKVKIRCSKCGSKSHLWKECPDNRKCARCSDPDNTQACQTVVIRTRMMKGCRDKGDLAQLQNLLSSLKTDGHKPTVHSYSTLLSLLVSKGQMQAAQKVLKTMEEDGVVADTICFNTILNGWCSIGKLEEAKAVLEELKDRQYKLTTSTYNTLIKGFGLAGQASEAMKLLQQMNSVGEAKPNKRTYNILINAWAEVKDVEQARWVLNLMRNAGFSPDVVTYNTIAKAYAELRRSFEAERVLEEMQNAYIRPNERTYGIIVNSYCETGRPEEGLALLDRMRLDGVRCNLAIYNILIKGFAELYQPENVDKVLGLMEASGVKPDVQSFSLVMNVWCSSGLVEEARAIFQRMQNVYIVRPDVMAFTILAKGYVRARRPAEAEGLLSEMASQGLKPNVFTYTTVISGWCNVGNMDDAFRIFKDMQSCGVSPNSNTVNTLIWGFCEAKEPQRAEEVLEAMKKMGIHPDRKCLELVAEAWRSVGHPAEARRVLRGGGSADAVSEDISLKSRFHAMIARRETVLDSNIHKKLTMEPELAEFRPSGPPHQIVINSMYTPMVAQGAAKTRLRMVGSMGALAVVCRPKTTLTDSRLKLQAFKPHGMLFARRLEGAQCRALAGFASQSPPLRCRGNCRVEQRAWGSIPPGAFPARTPAEMKAAVGECLHLLGSLPWRVPSCYAPLFVVIAFTWSKMIKHEY